MNGPLTYRESSLKPGHHTIWDGDNNLVAATHSWDDAYELVTAWNFVHRRNPAILSKEKSEIIFDFRPKEQQPDLFSASESTTQNR